MGSGSCRSTMTGFSAEFEPDGIARELAGTGGVGKDSAAICQRADLEANVRKLMLTTASILAIGIGGAGVSQAADTSNMAPNAGSNMPAMSGVPSASQSIVNPSRDQVREAQQQLRNQGLYRGRIDGILGPETKQALDRFQKNNGLSQTATLDQPTIDRLLGNPGVGQGSSTPPSVYHGTGTMTNPPPANPSAGGLGDHNTPRQ
jgi:Putative peptidoglycan binding domain